MSHGFDAIAVSLNLMRALSGHDGLTAWYILSAISLHEYDVVFLPYWQNTL